MSLCKQHLDWGYVETQTNHTVNCMMCGAPTRFSTIRETYDKVTPICGKCGGDDVYIHASVDIGYYDDYTPGLQFRCLTCKDESDIDFDEDNIAEFIQRVGWRA